MGENRIIEVSEPKDDYIKAVNSLLGQLTRTPHVFSSEDLREIIASGNSRLFLLSCNGTIAGMLTIGFYRSPVGKKAWIEDVVIDRKFRGKSLGKDLVKHAIEYVESEGGCTLMLTSNPSRIAANSLYKSLGFEIKQTNVYRLTLH